jgi:hypothetical protein
MDAPLGPLGAQSIVKQVVLQLLLHPCDDDICLGVPVLFGGSAFELYMPLGFSGGVASATGDMDLIVERADNDAGDPDRFNDLHDFMESVRHRVREVCPGVVWPEDELTCRVNFVSCGAYSMHVYVGRAKTVDMTLMSRDRAVLWRSLYPRQTVSVFCDTAVMGLKNVMNLPVISAGELWCRLHGVATGAQLPDKTPNIPPETNVAALCTAVRRMSLLLTFGLMVAVDGEGGGTSGGTGGTSSGTSPAAAVKLTSLDHIRVLVTKAGSLFTGWKPLDNQPRCWFLSMDAALFESAEMACMVVARHAAQQAARQATAAKPVRPAPVMTLKVQVGIGAVAMASTVPTLTPALEAVRKKELAAARRDSHRKVAASVHGIWKATMSDAVSGFLDKVDKDFRGKTLAALRRVNKRVASVKERVQVVKKVLREREEIHEKYVKVARQVVTGLTTLREQVAALLSAGSIFRDRVVAEVVKYDEGLMSEPLLSGHTDRINRVYAKMLTSVVTTAASSFSGATDLFPLDGVAVTAAGSLMQLPSDSSMLEQAMLCRKLLLVTMRAAGRTMVRLRATAATKAALVMGHVCVPMPFFRIHDLALLSSTRGAAVRVKSSSHTEMPAIIAGNAYTLQPVWDACTAMLRGVEGESVADDHGESKSLAGYWTVMSEIANKADNVCSAAECDVLQMVMGVVTAPAVHMVADAHMQLSVCGLAAKQWSTHVSPAGGKVIHPLLESISHLQAMTERLLR